jgi:serine/threonine protein kinase
MDELAVLSNASATYDEIASIHDPAPPLQFPDPVLGRAVRTTAMVYNPETGIEQPHPNVIYRAYPEFPNQVPTHAYLIGKKLKRAIYGCVRAASVLRLRQPPDNTSQPQPSCAGTEVWEYTTTMAAVKIIDWNAVRQMRGKHTEDPVKEVACMQYISRDGQDPHPNVLGTWDVLADEQYLYSFMPFCSGGEMFTYVERDGRFLEPVARHWFKQILQVS